jgi:hypothetical protein
VDKETKIDISLIILVLCLLALMFSIKLQHYRQVREIAATVGRGEIVAPASCYGAEYLEKWINLKAVSTCIPDGITCGAILTRRDVE